MRDRKFVKIKSHYPEEVQRLDRFSGPVLQSMFDPNNFFRVNQNIERAKRSPKQLFPPKSVCSR